jgi:hypothetical protein
MSLCMASSLSDARRDCPIRHVGRICSHSGHATCHRLCPAGHTLADRGCHLTFRASRLVTREVESIRELGRRLLFPGGRHVAFTRCAAQQRSARAAVGGRRSGSARGLRIESPSLITSSHGAVREGAQSDEQREGKLLGLSVGNVEAACLGGIASSVRRTATCPAPKSGARTSLAGLRLSDS